MAKKSKIRVMQSFVYKGKDGLLPNKKWITISPGEECPSLDSNEKERLIKDYKSQIPCLFPSGDIPDISERYYYSGTSKPS